MVRTTSDKEILRIFQGFWWDKLQFFKTTSKIQHLFKIVRTMKEYKRTNRKFDLR